MIEHSVRAVLLANAAVSALVGARVYPLVIPQASSWAGPTIRYQRISTTSPVTIDGFIGPDRARLQVDCWDKTWGGARALARAVRTALHGFSGLIPGQQALAGVFLESEGDDFEEGAGPGGEGLYRVRADYFVHPEGMEVAA